MHRAQPFQHPLHAGGQRLVGGALAGEERIAAEGRDFLAVQDGAHRRGSAHGGIRVPFLADDRGIARLPADHHHFRVGAGALEIRVDEDFAEAPGKGLVLIRVQRLVAEEHHAMGVQRRADLGDGAIIGRPREIHAR
jgi:hypothetical protein